MTMGSERNLGLFLAVIILTWATATSCMASSPHIANGVYREPAMVETVAIQGEEIEFQISVSDGKESRVLKRKYKYRLLSGGKIHVIASSNDSAFVFGIMKYDWFWNGWAIVREDPKTRNTTTFERE